MFTDDFYMESATFSYFSTTWLDKKSWYVRKKWPIFTFFGKFSSHFVSRFFYSSSRLLKPLLYHTKNICGQYKTIFMQFESIPFSLDGPPIRSFLSKSWNGDYVIRDDVIGYPDIATDSNWPNEHAGIISFYQLWHRKIGRSLARVSLSPRDYISCILNSLKMHRLRLSTWVAQMMHVTCSMYKKCINLCHQKW